MLYRLWIPFILCFVFLGCNKPNPNPESLDPIYADLVQMAGSTHSELESAKKDLEGHQKELDSAVPQTGQNKYAIKRISEVQARINRLEQMELYYELKAKSRLKEDQITYLKAFHDKKPWPPPEEWESYQAEKRLRQAPKDWNAKTRMEEARRNYGVDMSFRTTKQTQAPAKEKETSPKED